MGKKGRKSSRGQGETNWGQPKTKNLTVKLTEDGYNAVKSKAEKSGLSVSEVLERWGRNYAIDEKPTKPVEEEGILHLLPRLAKESLGRIAKTCIDMLSGVPSVRKTRRIAELVRENWEVTRELTEDLISPERLDAIANGMRPTDEELEQLSSPLGLGLQNLEQMRYTEFGNGHTHQRSSNGI
ncbi:MAG TPA: hypothetical protein V6D33_09055 [Cyanophyceae cyanobacterium]